MFNEFKFSDTTKAQIAGRIEQRRPVRHRPHLRRRRHDGIDAGLAAAYTPKSASVGLIQNLPWDLVGSITAQYVERAPKPAELFSGGGHDATVTFDKGNPNLKIEAAQVDRSRPAARQGAVPLRGDGLLHEVQGLHLSAADRQHLRRRYRHLRPGAGELNEAIYSQADATFRGGEFQSQWDVAPLGDGMFGIENQFDVVRATFTDGSNVPRIPPVRIGGGVFWRDANWLARVKLLHAFAQNNIAPIAETTTPGYDDLRAEMSYTWKPAKPTADELSEVTVGLSGTNLLNRDIRNSVSYSKDEVLMPGASVRLFTRVKY